jgi:hypothetical protein
MQRGTIGRPTASGRSSRRVPMDSGTARQNQVQWRPAALVRHATRTRHLDGVQVFHVNRPLVAVFGLDAVDMWATGLVKATSDRQFTRSQCVTTRLEQRTGVALQSVLMFIESFENRQERVE